jgi:hypothetical protein
MSQHRLQGLLQDVSPGGLIFDYGPSGHENIEMNQFMGTIEVNYEDLVADIVEEQFGVVDQAISGHEITITAPFTRFKHHDMWKLFPNQTEKISGDQVEFYNEVGQSQLAQAKPLVIRPIVGQAPSTDLSEWILFPYAAPRNVVTLGYDRETQRVWQVEFRVFPKQDGTKKGLLFQLGIN